MIAKLNSIDCVQLQPYLLFHVGCARGWPFVFSTLFFKAAYGNGELSSVRKTKKKSNVE